MKKQFMYLVLMLLMIVSACGVLSSGDDSGGSAEEASITDQDVENYIKTYKVLREQAPDMLKTVNESGESPEAGAEAYKSIEQTISNNGIGSYADFVRLNAKIGAIFSIMQATKGMTRFEELNQRSNDMFDDGIRQIDEQLADPNVPEDTKVELRKTREELLAGKGEMNEDYQYNKDWGEFVMDKANKLSGLVISEADIKVVQRHEQEIMEAYVGFPLPYNGELPPMPDEE